MMRGVIIVFRSNIQYFIHFYPSKVGKSIRKRILISTPSKIDSKAWYFPLYFLASFWRSCLVNFGYSVGPAAVHFYILTIADETLPEFQIKKLIPAIEIYCIVTPDLHINGICSVKY